MSTQTRLFKTLFVALGCVFLTPFIHAQTTITIQNNCMWDIYHVHISPADSDEWGDDLLGETDILESGESERFTFLSSGRYDIKVIDEDGDECIMWGVYLQSSETWTITDDSHLDCIDLDEEPVRQTFVDESSSVSLTLSNTSMWDMYHVYISPAQSDDWGDDLLGEYDVLETGEAKRFYLGGSGNYDIKIIDEDGDECFMWNVAIRGAETFTITDDSHLDCIN